MLGVIKTINLKNHQTIINRPRFLTLALLLEYQKNWLTNADQLLVVAAAASGIQVLADFAVEPENKIKILTNSAMIVETILISILV